MKTELQRTCESIIYNRDILKDTFRMEDNRILAVCASLYTAANRVPDRESLLSIRKDIRRQVSVFSEIRGYGLSVITCMIDLRGGQEEHILQMIKAYETLRRQFHASSLLAVAAQLLAEGQKEEDYDAIAVKAKAIYRDMRANHPFVTASDDYLYCVIQAQTDLDETYICQEMEYGFTALRNSGLRAPRDAVQAVCSTLVLYKDSMDVKAERTAQMYDAVRSLGRRYDKYYGLPVLAVLSQKTDDVKTCAKEIDEVNQWLKTKSGFGFWLGESSRMMYAAMIVSMHYEEDPNNSSSVANGVISAIIAQQAATAACIASASAAAASSHSH